MARLVIALGGNALLRRGERPDAAIQLEHLAAAAPALARAAREHEVVIVHGNGPQVGLLALESTADTGLSRPYPLDALVAETQGLIGYFIQQSLTNAGAGAVTTVLGQVLVDAEDPAFGAPSKFVGPQYSPEDAAMLAARHGWTMALDGGSLRRTVPSPQPAELIELDAVRALLARGQTVVVAGGGGIPVVRTADGLRGVEAVIDKDLTAALVAIALEADRLVVLTDVEAVIDGYGTPRAAPIGEVTAAELAAGDWAAGSMGPKIAAVCRYVEATGRAAAIGSLDAAADVIDGRSGTRVR